MTGPVYFDSVEKTVFIPYQVDVPMQRWPIANWVLIGLTIVTSLAMLVPLDEWARRRSPVQGVYTVDPQTMKLIPVEPDTSPSIVDSFLLQPDNFHVAQLAGHLFIHAGLFHLLGNMLFLFVFGNAVNAKLGNTAYAGLYLGSGVLVGLAWLAGGSGHPCLGASGAIMGIVGAFLILYPLNDVSVGYMFTFWYRGVFQLSAMWLIAFYVAFDVWGLAVNKNSGVAYLSHVVGFTAGAGTVAVVLALKWIEMDRHERSLLQVWHFMEHENDPGRRPQQAAQCLPVTSRQSMRPQVASGTRKGRDEGPISLD